MKQMKRKYKPQNYTGQVTGIRVPSEVWAKFIAFAKMKGLTGNSLANRLIRHSIQHNWVPEFVPDPQLPGYIPEKEREANEPETFPVEPNLKSNVLYPPQEPPK
jgi:hypothetical protein